MSSRLKLLALLLFAMLASCAPRPTPYIERGAGEYGYSDMLIGDSTYRVIFAGNAQTGLELTDRYSLYRAAEITLENGGDYFILFSDKDDINMTSQSSVMATSDANVAHNAQPAGSVFPTTTTATASSSVSSSSSSYTLHSSIKNFQYFGGRRPSNNPNAYDARALIKNKKAQLPIDQQRADDSVRGINTLYTVYYVLSAVVTIVFLAAVL